MKNSIIHDTAILFLITLISGLALGAVYSVTKEPIARQKVLAENRAYLAVFPEATGFTAMDETIVEAGNEAIAAQGQVPVVEAVSEAVGGSGSLGYVMKVTTPEGYGGDITISLGVRSDGTVTGVEMLTISETAGLGMKAKDGAFNDQYDGKQVEEFQVTKTGEDGDSMIDAISGATITSRAVTGAVNAGLAFYRQMAAQ